MKFGAPRPVADLLVAAVPDLRDRLVEWDLQRAWAEIAGPEVARRSRPRSLSRGVLTVVVDNSPWLHELTLRASELAERLRRRHAGINAVRLVLGALEPQDTPARARAASPVPLDAEARRAIDAAAAAIPDESVAAAARRLMTTAWRFPRERGRA